MQIRFRSILPFAIQVFMNDVNVVSGANIDSSNSKQDYIVTPGQIRINGHLDKDDEFKQFVGSPPYFSSSKNHITKSWQHPESLFKTLYIKVMPLKRKALPIWVTSSKMQVKLEVDLDYTVRQVEDIGLEFNIADPTRFPYYPKYHTFKTRFLHRNPTAETTLEAILPLESVRLLMISTPSKQADEEAGI